MENMYRIAYILFLYICVYSHIYVCVYAIMFCPGFGDSDGIISTLYFSIFSISVELKRVNNLAALIDSNFRYNLHESL